MYQGRLNDGGSPANNNYDLRFALYNAPTNGNAISAPQTNFAVAVTGGLFTTNLDFGPVFTGTNYWLSIGVRTNGDTNAFTLLWPRQPLLPVPYAIFATTASNLSGTLPATQLAGTLSSAQLSGTYLGQVTFTNSGNNFYGSFFGAFSGNGANLVNLNGSQIASGTVADARLSGNVALLNASQTFSGANNFTNVNNAFSGSFFGNGLVGWITVSGTSQPAARDHGYMLTNSDLTTVTLPASSGLINGDIVRISGAGAGGWLVAENSGQSILGNFASYHNGFLVALPGGDDYSDVAASADGTRMYAVSKAFTGVYASSDSGHTWSQVGTIPLSGYWQAIACSANGKIVFTVPSGGGTVQMSTDSGTTWSAISSSGSYIACTADGSKIFTSNYACSGNGNYLARLAGGVISVSINGGASWISVTAPDGGLSCVAASSDCTRLVAGSSYGLLYASANRGATWTTLTTASQYWSGAWMSADGSQFAATASKIGGIAGGIYSSSTGALPNTVSTNNTICGSQGSAVELQFIGNNQFMPVSSTGLIWAN